MTQRKQSSNDTDLWDSQWQKRPFKWTPKHTRAALFALAGVVLVGVIWWRLFSAGPESPQEAKDYFDSYVFELMEEYKPRYALYEQLADPAALMEGERWQRIDLHADAPDEPVRQLLGEGCVLRSWENLKQAEADRLWKAWYVERQGNRMDVFIITELSLHIEHQTLPALRENTWLVQTPQGDPYLLAHADGVWGVKLLAYFR